MAGQLAPGLNFKQYKPFIPFHGDTMSTFTPKKKPLLPL
jgi:hypothetical protein